MATPRKSTSPRPAAPRPARATVPREIKAASDAATLGVAVDEDGAPVAFKQAKRAAVETALVFTSNPEEEDEREWHTVSNLPLQHAMRIFDRINEQAERALAASRIGASSAPSLPLRILLEEMIVEEDAAEVILDSGTVELTNEDFIGLTNVLSAHLTRAAGRLGN